MHSGRQLARRSGGVSARSARPIFAVHSAWACQAALRSVHEIGPLGAGDPLGMREGHSLSDKELETMMDNPIEDGVRPGGGSAILF